MSYMDVIMPFGGGLDEGGGVWREGGRVELFLSMSSR